MSVSEKFEVGTQLFVEKAGSGFKLIEGYIGTVISKEEVRQEKILCEGLDEEKVEFYLQIDDDIYNHNGEVEFDGTTIWGVSTQVKGEPLFKVLAEAKDIYRTEYVEGEGWSIVKGDQCYDWGLATKEEAEKEIMALENQSRVVVNGNLID